VKQAESSSAVEVEKTPLDFIVEYDNKNKSAVKQAESSSAVEVEKTPLDFIVEYDNKNKSAANKLREFLRNNSDQDFSEVEKHAIFEKFSGGSKVVVDNGGRIEFYSDVLQKESSMSEHNTNMIVNELSDMIQRGVIGSDQAALGARKLIAAKYSDVSENKLKNILYRIPQRFPNIGDNLMESYEREAANIRNEKLSSMIGFSGNEKFDVDESVMKFASEKAETTDNKIRKDMLDLLNKNNMQQSIEPQASAHKEAEKLIAEKPKKQTEKKKNKRKKEKEVTF
jgi:hypothetical protein